MKGDDVFDGMNGISPELLAEAESHVFRRRRKTRTIQWAAAAVAAVLLCGVGVYAATGGFTVKKLNMNGYEVSARIRRIPMKEIKGDVNEASAAIIEQFKNHQPFDNLFPGSFYKTLGSAEEAAAYIGYEDLQIPAFPYDHADVQVAVVGDKSGRLSEIQIMRDCLTEKVTVQNWTTLFTEHYDRDVFDIGFVGDASGEPEEYTTAAGLSCLVFQSDAQNPGRKMMTAYITTGNVVYMCHCAFDTADQAAAEQIIRDWAESIR